MRKLGSVSFLICLMYILLNCLQISAQYPQKGGGQHRVTGWIDDTHFILQTLDKENKQVTLSVDVKSGKSVPYVAPKSPRDILGESLPKGVTLSFSDILSPDIKSVVIIKDNDLYYFKKGGKRAQTAYK